MRNVERKLSTVQQKKYANEFSLFRRVLSQTKNTKGKIYSFHGPKVYCIGKGKATKKYEFGSKFGVLWSKSRGIWIVKVE